VGKILAAVGGTGQEIALACLRLSHMAGLEMPRVFVFDSDSDTQRAERIDVPTRSGALKDVGRLIAKYTNQDPSISSSQLIANCIPRILVASSAPLIRPPAQFRISLPC
jgi:hypothetical protein